MYDLQTRFEQSAHQRKAKKYVIVENEISISDRLSFWTCPKKVA